MNIVCEKVQSDELAQSLIPEDPCGSILSTTSNKNVDALVCNKKEANCCLQNEMQKERQQVLTFKPKNSMDAMFSPVPSSSSFNSLELLANQSLSRDDDELSALDENDVLLEGEVL